MNCFGITGRRYAYNIAYNVGQKIRKFATDGASTSEGTSLVSGPWDVNNRVRTAGATIGLATAVGLLFDTFYRRATKQELKDLEFRLDQKIDQKFDKLDQKIDQKFDGLTHALLHTQQRDNLAKDQEIHELKREVELLKISQS